MFKELKEFTDPLCRVSFAEKLNQYLLFFNAEESAKILFQNYMNFHQGEPSLMNISVILKNGTPDSVPDYLLSAMIEAGEVTSFKRSSGWVKIGVDPVRRGDPVFCYYGPEKRSLSQRRLCHTCPHFIETECSKEICQIRYMRFRNYTK